MRRLSSSGCSIDDVPALEKIHNAICLDRTGFVVVSHMITHEGETSNLILTLQGEGGVSELKETLRLKDGSDDEVFYGSVVDSGVPKHFICIGAKVGALRRGRASMHKSYVYGILEGCKGEFVWTTADLVEGEGGGELGLASINRDEIKSMFHNSDIPTFGTASGTSSVASVPTPNLLPVEKTLGNQGQEQKDIDMPEDDGGVQKLADEFHAAIVSPRMLNSVPESAFAKASDEAGGITKVDPPQCVEDDDEVAKTISETIARQVTPPTPPKPPSPALSSPPRSTAVSVDTDVLSPDTLRGKTPEGVNPAKKEERLSDETFEEIFGCTKIEFNKKAKWRQVQDKKKHGFF